MNSDAFFSFTTIQKDLQLPANDFAAKPKAQTRRANESTSTSSTYHTQQNKTQTEKSDKKSFDDYISDTKLEQATHKTEKTDSSSQEPVSYSQLDDLRALLADLLADLKDKAETEQTEEDQDPEDILLSFFADGKVTTDTPEQTEEDRNLFLTQPAVQTPKILDQDKQLPQGLLNLLNTVGGRNGLEALAEFLNRDDLTSIDGITPEVLTQLQQEIETAIKDDRDFDSFAALNEIIVRIVELSKPEAANPDAVQQAAELGTEDAPAIGHKKESRFEKRYDLDRFSQGDARETDDSDFDFRSALRAAQAVHKPDGSAADAALKTSVSKPALLLAFGGENGLFTLPGDQGVVTPAVNGGVAVSSPALSGPSLINPSVHAASAAQPHPAVQTVAATIQKFGGGEKQDTQITLQLDPPELGRVEVKMSMNKDNAAKVVLTIEKPETYAMLQRDAHVLERALADAGLSPDGSGLEFSLADDGYSFGRDGGQGGGGKGYSETGAGDEQTVIVASSMGWSINPETGRMQYDVLV